MKHGKLYPVTTLPLKVRLAFPQAKTVADALESILIHVTRRDRDKATPQDQLNCAMAKASCREHKADGAYIGMTRSYLLFGDRLIRFETPITVGREIVAYDRHEDFATGAYRLSKIAPGGSASLHSASKRASSQANRSKKRPRRDGKVIPKHFTTRVRG